MKLSIGYITAPTKSEARQIVASLLEEELIACANIFDGVESHFVWDGELTHAAEVVIIVKTRQKNEDKISRLVRHMSSYECPCVVFIPMGNGNPEFLEWVETTLS